ncbi:MAG: hypothetical protein ACI9TH_002559 [Kiritimatiellia bacterium]|jgi:hypothetical protein
MKFKRLMYFTMAGLGSLFGSVQACQVPVFRYALERWQSDVYRVAVFHRDDLTENHQGALKQIERAIDDPERYANLALEVVNVDAVTDPFWKKYLETHPAGDEPEIHLLYPYEMNNDAPIWRAPLTPVNAQGLVDSPVRRALLEHIVQGESGVWILLESGDAAQDDKAESDVKGWLASISKELTLPEGVVGREQAEEALKNPGFDPANILRSQIPLKIGFSLLRVSRSDVAESAFLAMLLNMEDDLHELADKTMLFPVFGRGRALPPILGDGITEDNVADYSSYLCGACSCEVKRENPGIDLVFSINWDDLMEGNATIIDKALPPLMGVADLIGKQSIEPAGENPVEAAVVEPEAVTPPPAPASVSPGGSKLTSNLIIAVASVLGLVVFGSIFTMMRKSA